MRKRTSMPKTSNESDIFMQMLRTQADFQELLCHQKFGKATYMLSEKEVIQILKDHVLMTMAELVELLNHFNYKMHKKDHPIDREKAIEEFVDAMKLMMYFFVYMPIGVDE